jgi:hypothetical protein
MTPSQNHDAGGAGVTLVQQEDKKQSSTAREFGLSHDNAFLPKDKQKGPKSI